MFPNPLCCRTVTVYRYFGGAVQRRVLEDCFYSYGDRCDGQTQKRSFLLIAPHEIPLAPGDRVFDGIGPEAVDWETFLPARVPGLSQVEQATPYYIEGRFSHWEAK